jgi:hypothetical protein
MEDKVVLGRGLAYGNWMDFRIAYRFGAFPQGW